MIAWLRRWLLGEPCPVCHLPVLPEDRPHHLAWHRALRLAGGDPRATSTNPRPVRPAQPRRRENGGPT